MRQSEKALNKMADTMLQEPVCGAGGSGVVVAECGPCGRLSDGHGEFRGHESGV